MKPIVLLFLLGLLPAGLWAQRPAKLEKREVADIRFIGDSAISALELESIIATRNPSGTEQFINSINSDWGTPRQYIDETTLTEDTLRIFAYYRDRGYFDVQVSDTIHEAPLTLEEEKEKEQNILLPASKRKEFIREDTVIFRIKEGKSYKVQGFTFEGFERLPMDLQDKVTSNIGIKQNSQYSKLALQLETARVKQILAENGYPFLTPVYILVEPDTLRKTVTISLRFKTGPRIRLGNTRIVYDTAYAKLGYVKENVVRTQLSLDSGSWYKYSNVLATIRDLGKLNTFQYQNVTLDTSQFVFVPDSLRNGLTLPVIVTLRMHQAVEILPGLDFGISALSQFILGFEISYTNRNVFKSADNFTAHASYQLFPTSQNRENIGADFSIPSVFGWKGVPLLLSANFTYDDERSLATHELQYLERSIVGSLGWNLQFFNMFNNPAATMTWVPKGTLQLVYRVYRDSSIGIHLDTLQPQQFNAIFSNDLSLSTVNDQLNPSRGQLLGISVQRTLPIDMLWKSSLHSAAYTKFTPRFKTFFNLSNAEGRSILGFHIMYGQILLDHPDDPTRDVLIENRYFGGGTNSLRGWPARSMLVSNNTDPGRPYYGGYKAFETNIEWRVALFNYPAEITATQQFLGATRLAFFMDAGNIFDKDVYIAPKDFAIALGTGIRYNTLFGAIRLDFGFKLYDPFPEGTIGKNRNTYLAIPPNSTGVWLFNRKWTSFWDICNIEFAFGQAF